MGTDYLAVHLKFTIPPAILLTAIFWPLRTRLDACKIGFLITIAVLSTTPWDSWLIYHNIWGYSDSAVLGLNFLKIPIEEYFFFVIQTYTTSVLYLLLSKPVLHAAYLTEIRGRRCQTPRDRANSFIAIFGMICLVSGILLGAWAIQTSKKGSYMGLIAVWAGPFILLLWSLAYRHILSLPHQNLLWPIFLPTVYLWLVDTWALRRGTWVINSGTKLGIQLWEGLEIEEAVFFLVTNTLVVFGLVAFDYALAIVDAFPSIFPHVGTLPSPVLLFSALLTKSFPHDEYEGVLEAIEMLMRKSRSFYMASGVFEGRLRLDLISLYSFCRAADDLIDNAATFEEAQAAAHKLQEFLDLAYEKGLAKAVVSRKAMLQTFVRDEFPEWAQAALLSLPYRKLPREPLDELLAGFKTDLSFMQPMKQLNGDSSTAAHPATRFPIQTEDDLEVYARQVAGTVGEMFGRLAFFHAESSPAGADQERLITQATTMGIALQYVNIARDVREDAKIGRVYIPNSWLEEAGLTPDEVLKNPAGAECFQKRLLDKAKCAYTESRGGVDELPKEARFGARLAVETYMDIGRRLEEGTYKGLDKGKSKWLQEPRVVKIMRMYRAWRVLQNGR